MKRRKRSIANGRYLRQIALLLCLTVMLSVDAWHPAIASEPSRQQTGSSQTEPSQAETEQPQKPEKPSVTYKKVKEGTWVYKKNYTYFKDKKDQYVKKSWQVIGKNTYYFGAKGRMKKGWFTYRKQEYYLNTDGHMQKGWLTLGKKKYYFSQKGVLQKGLVKIGKKKYYFHTTTGAMKTGFVKISGKKYYFNSKGVMKTGWLTLSDGKTYYFDGNGVMQTGPCFINGKGYVFRSDGTLDRDAVYTGINPKGKMVALTFDDGPSRYTMTLLNTLEKYHAKATFFMVGESVSSYPSTVRKMYDIGCELGNHTYSHPSLTSLGSSQIASQISSTNAKIRAITGHNATVVRPPYGNCNSYVLSAIGAPAILWSIDPRDWATLNTYSTVSHVKQHVRDGSIILIHDLYNASVQAAIQLIPWLQSQGYQLVTVSEMGKYRLGGLKAGVKYYSMYP